MLEQFFILFYKALFPTSKLIFFLKIKSDGARRNRIFQHYSNRKVEKEPINLIPHLKYNHSMEDREADLIKKLERLTIETKETVEELQRIRRTKASGNEIHVGDTVSILNPKPNQGYIGIVTSIGKTLVTIEQPNGKKVRRARKNVTKTTIVNGPIQRPKKHGYP